ncbi:MAG: glutathione S-transferase family protein [Pseudomonadota bacterium]
MSAVDPVVQDRRTTADASGPKLELQVFGPMFGLPDPSPFCAKAIVLLKLSGLAFETVKFDMVKAPKGKAPVLMIDGEPLPDSTFIRFALEDRFGVDFDGAMSAKDKGVAWAAEKMAEDHLYYVIMSERWVDDANFQTGPAQYFDEIPQPIRPVIRTMVRRRVRKTLHAQGFGRHTIAEQTRLAVRGYEAIGEILSDRPWLGGEAPCGSDASVWASVACIMADSFGSPTRDAIQANTTLKSYRDRGMKIWFPEFAKRLSIESSCGFGWTAGRQR